MHSELGYYGVRHDDLQDLNILQVEKGSKSDDEEKTGVSKSPLHGLQYDYRIIDLESATLTRDTHEAIEWAVEGRINNIVNEIAGYR